jgi:hypothetical protein
MNDDGIEDPTFLPSPHKSEVSQLFPPIIGTCPYPPIGPQAPSLNSSQGGSGLSSAALRR